MTFPAASDLKQVFTLKYGDQDSLSWGPRLRHQAGYFTPDDIYEATVIGLVDEGTHWLDVGGGRDVFPSNSKAAWLLSKRCRLLVGIDPSDNIHSNEFVHQRFQTTIEDYKTDLRFDVATLRMVAEHITSPQQAVKGLANLVRPGGRVIVYTVHRWSPISLVSSLIPFALHNHVKQIFWRTQDRDTFPVAYLMNTRSALEQVFSSTGFQMLHFTHLDDCRTFARWRVLTKLELMAWKLLKKGRLHYPETCILGIFERLPERDQTSLEDHP